MAWQYDEANEAEYRPADQGVRFWLQDDAAPHDNERRVAIVIGNPELQRLGGDGDRNHMEETFRVHRNRIVAAAMRRLAVEQHPPVPQTIRLAFEDLPPA